MARGVKFVPDDVGAIVDAYRAGQTAAQIALRVGSSQDTVYRLLKAQGVRVREGGLERKPVEPEEVARLYEDGWTVTELSQIFNCYRATIYHRLLAAGVDARAKRQPQGEHRRNAHAAPVTVQPGASALLRRGP